MRQTGGQLIRSNAAATRPLLLNLIVSNDVLMSTNSDHNLIYIKLKLQTHYSFIHSIHSFIHSFIHSLIHSFIHSFIQNKGLLCNYQSYTNYNSENFLQDLSLTSFHIVSFFYHLNDQVDAFNDLF